MKKHNHAQQIFRAIISSFMYFLLIIFLLIIFLLTYLNLNIDNTFIRYVLEMIASMIIYSAFIWGLTDEKRKSNEKNKKE